MILSSVQRILGLLACVVLVAACGNEKPKFNPDAVKVEGGKEAKGAGVKVNRYLWTASLDVLDFLPIQSADPFTGVISTGYGTPPGGGRAYRATILVSDPALDARSLNVALQSRNGAVSAGTQLAVEDAILSRARQLRIQAGRY